MDTRKFTLIATQNGIVKETIIRGVPYAVAKSKQNEVKHRYKAFQLKIVPI